MLKNNHGEENLQKINTKHFLVYVHQTQNPMIIKTFNWLSIKLWLSSQIQVIKTYWLKGQVTFLKLCLSVVCQALIIPRFTLFWWTTVFRPKNTFICLCQRSLRWHSYKRWWVFGSNTKKRTGSIVAFFGQFPIHLYHAHTRAHALFSEFTCL